MSDAAVVAVQQERARIGNVEVIKHTALVATDQGFAVVEQQTIEHHPPRPTSFPALSAPRPEPLPSRPAPRPDYPWYDIRGKGICAGILLLLLYLVGFVICLPFMALACVCVICSNDNDD